MKIITTTCEECGTVVAGNILERERRLNCPRIGCNHELSFYDLDGPEQRHLVENRELYRIGD